ncbi:Bleomycin hydrolase, partial [Armadillidium nasatum]
MDLKSFEEELCQIVRSTVLKLEDEWDEMDLPKHQRETRRIAAYDGLSELGLSYVIPEDLPMLELDTYLKKKLSQLQDLKKKRLEELIELKGKDEMLCRYLGETPYQISRDLIPSEESLNMLKEHISEMEDEKVRRVETYQKLRIEVLHFVEQLEKPLEGETLLDIVCSVHPESSLTKNFLLDLRKLHNDLEFEVRELEAYSLEIREKITSLWNLLKISQEKRDSFLSTVPSHTYSCVKKMENQLIELKELRIQNMGKFIEELKLELQKCWEKCFVGDDQKKEFAYFNLDEISEEALEAYESEVLKWKKFYEKNIQIFETVEHLLSLFDTMQQLEERAKDPSRLFNTRGGALLQEEKERNKVKQELPHAQEQLILLCHKYSLENGLPFIIDGETVEDYLSRIWEYHDLQKEREKIERQSRTKPPITPKLAKGLTSKRVPQIVITPADSRKRCREVCDIDGKPSAKRIAKTPSGVHSGLQTPQKEFKTPITTRSVGKLKALSERNHFTPLQPRTNNLSHDESLQAPFSYKNFK